MLTSIALVTSWFKLSIRKLLQISHTQILNICSFALNVKDKSINFYRFRITFLLVSLYKNSANWNVTSELRSAKIDIALNKAKKASTMIENLWENLSTLNWYISFENELCVCFHYDLSNKYWVLVLLPMQHFQCLIIRIIETKTGYSALLNIP